VVGCSLWTRELDKISSFVESHGCILQIKHGVPKAFKKVEYKRSVLSEEEKIIYDILSRYYSEA